MLLELGNDSLGEQGYNPFKWEVWGMAKARKTTTKILGLNHF